MLSSTASSQLWLRFVVLLIPAGLLGVSSGCDADGKPAAPATAVPDGAASAAGGPGSEPVDPLAKAATLHQSGASGEAMQIVQGVLIAAPENVRAITLAIQIHAVQGELAEAATLAERLAELDPENASQVLVKAFDWRLRTGRHRRAERNLRAAIRARPDAGYLHRSMAQFLNAQGRRFEAGHHSRMLARLDEISRQELLSLVDISGPFSLVSFDEVVDFSQVSLFSLGKARFEFSEQANPERALEMIEEIEQEFPEVPAVAALKGRILSETGDTAGLAEWMKQLPAGIDDHPEYWFAIGHWLSLSERHEEAIRAFAEALRRDSTDRQSLRLMIASLDQIDRTELGDRLRPKLEMLDDIFRKAKDADAEQAVVIAGQMEKLTRPWESNAWLKVAAYQTGQYPRQAAELAARRQTILNWESSANPEQIEFTRLKALLGFDFQSFPLPDLDTVIVANSSDSDEFPVPDIQLVDVAESAQLVTSFDSGHPLNDEPYFLYHVNGGGLALFDYDRDGQCDVYVAQSGGIPHQESSTANQLFRQLDGQFAEVTSTSGGGDRRYGQGVCAGDLNQDGFLDLLIANIGRNRVYLNQGDGTFRECEELKLFGEDPSDWTSSIAIGDLNGDQLPEIVVANYVADPEIYRVSCEAKSTLCAPHRFSSAADQIYLNRGDGTFEPWEAVANIRELPNYGFAILIANVDGQHGNDVFITNDGDLNHYWVSQPAADRSDRGPSDRYRLLESAGALGCSIGANGRSQACMGLAHGDFDRNGMIDFHVTNFYTQSSNLYLQSKSGFFVDDALKFGIREASESVLGFGTHAVDVDNDGWQEIAVLNGHVHDDRHHDVAFEMEPQLLHGQPGRFVQLDPKPLGDYWTRRNLGRTLAVWDWNRDGRIDLLANHLDLPVALLENRSTAGNWLQLELVGATSEREAIGASVRFRAGNQQWTRWQTGGDGYMCSNEPVVHVGLGEAQRVSELEVKWPGGSVQRWQDLDTNQRLLLIENEAEPWRR